MRMVEGVDVRPLLLSLKQQPELWDQNQLRRTLDGTPHGDMRDIWIRWRADAYDAGKKGEFLGPHFPIWYPAFYTLPLRNIIFAMMADVQATHLGGILITRIAPGESIKPHADKGWHPEFYNTKLYLPLATNDKCVFRVEDERVVMKVGEVWWLDNTVEHEVTNDGDTERITLIVCTRRE